jgi:hypothetical protein
VPKAKKVVRKAGKIEAVTKAAKSAVGGTSKKQKALIAGGALAVIGLMTTKKGRGLLKVAAGFAAPVLATVARKKVVHQVSAAL